MELGSARPEDLPQLVAFLGTLFSQESEFTPDDGKQSRALEKILSDPSAGVVYVARAEGRVIAMASLIFTISTAEGGTAALFEDLFVLPASRGRGVATALVKFVIEQARKQGVLRITLLTDAHNDRAQSLYRKLGFTDSAMRPMRLKL
jgi:GNAT superfamily N-acetyltransferase